MASLQENIAQAISDFDNIKAAIIDNGVEVPYGTDTKEYGNLIKQACEAQYGEGYNAGVSEQPEMYLLVDEAGNEYPAVLVDEEVSFDATANDIREGKVAATDSGVTLGTKVIPSYHTHHGSKVVPAGKSFVISSEHYDYTVLHAFVCSYNTNLQDSVAAEKIAVYDNVYDVKSTKSIAVIEKKEGNIVFNITNETEQPQILRYIYYKEIE